MNMKYAHVCVYVCVSVSTYSLWSYSCFLENGEIGVKCLLIRYDD